MRVLVVEDEPAIAERLRKTLAGSGYAVDVSGDGDEACFLGETEAYDVVILDLGLPGLDGIAILRKWRASGRTMPVLILTARGTWHEKVEGIDAGADDYLAKPFEMEELQARLRALIRRSNGLAAPVMTCGDLTLDTRSGRVTRDGKPLSLTALEYRVFAYLMHRRGRTVSRTELTEHIYAQDFDRDSNTIEVMIGRIRRKLERDVIVTRRGLGYQIEADE